MKDIIITTTNSIENATIEKYLGVITSNLVIGTGFFSDFKASFSDFFGGMSGAYRKQMDRLYQQASEAISIKAKSIGANCILGYRIDFDEISGKGTSMFMISVSGTAVKIKLNERIPEQTAIHNTVSSEILNIGYFKHKWEQRRKDMLPTEDEWNFILQHNLAELAADLYGFYVTAYYDQTYEASKLTVNNFRTFLANMPYDEAVEVIYQDYIQRHDIAFDLIRDNHLFCPQKIYPLIEQGYPELAAELLGTEKDEYTDFDLEKMIDLVKAFERLPDKGKIQEIKSILSSKIVEMYICPKGHKNDKKVEFCTSCGLNIKGLTKANAKEIEWLKTKVSILQELIK